MINQVIFYKKAITIKNKDNKFTISPNIGINKNIDLNINEYRALMEYYGEWDSSKKCFILNDDLSSYNAFEIGSIDANANVVKHTITFNETKAFDELKMLMLKSSITTTLGVALDYDSLNDQAKKIFTNKNKIKSLILSVFKIMAGQLHLNSNRNYIIYLSKCKYPNNLLGASIQEITNINLNDLTYTILDSNKYCSYGYNYKYFKNYWLNKNK